jgi:hypothetical protein
MARTVTVLPTELTTLFFNSGDRQIIAVEGPTDVEVLDEWYLARLSEVYFHNAGGHAAVEAIVAMAADNGVHKRVFGIIDRDFSDDAVVEAALADSNAHLFILRRYSIENYLLEPEAVHEVARIFLGRPPTRSVQATHGEILRICRLLKSMMAANWALLDNNCELYPEAHEIVGRELYAKRISASLPCDNAHAATLLAEREGILEPDMANLETAHSRTSGKHLFHHVWLFIIKKRAGATTGLSKDFFRRLLANKVKQTTGVHDDIKAIVEGRVLAAAV